jgi:glycogen synthase
VAAMKVLMTADTVGGVFTYAADLAAALRARGTEVVLATFGAPPSDDQCRMLGDTRVHPSSLALEWMPDPWRDLAEAEAWLLQVEADERPDVVHLNAYAHGAAPFRAPKLVVGHSCVLSWWRAVQGAEAPDDWRRYRDVVTAGLHGADAVVAPTCWMLDELERLYGPLPARRAVIHNGSSASPAGGPKEPFVLAAGRFWDRAKNLAVLDAAAVGLGHPVLVAGETPDGFRSTAVRPLGRLDREQLADVRSRAAVFAAPALYEPFGLGVLEAALSGCSLVLGDIPSLRELWDGAARFVDPREPEGLRAALRTALLTPRLAVARAERYSLEAMAAGYESLYVDLARMAVAA